MPLDVKHIQTPVFCSAGRFARCAEKVYESYDVLCHINMQYTSTTGLFKQGQISAITESVKGRKETTSVYGGP